MQSRPNIILKNTNSFLCLSGYFLIQDLKSSGASQQNAARNILHSVSQVYALHIVHLQFSKRIHNVISLADIGTFPLEEELHALCHRTDKLAAEGIIIARLEPPLLKDPEAIFVSLLVA